MTTLISKTPAFDEALKKATKAHQGARFAEAAAGYEALLPTAPNDAQIRYLLGAAYVELNRTAEAVSELEQALRLRARHLPTIEMLGSAWLRGGVPEKAVPHFREADAVAGGTPDTMGRLANALRLSGQYAEAREVYSRLLVLNPADRHAMVGAAICVAAVGNLPEAEEILRRCIQQHSGYAGAYTTFALVLGQAERFAEAEQVLRAFLADNPSHPEARRLLANTLHRQGRLADAEIIYRDILRAAPADAQTALQFAEALVDNSKLDEAEAVLVELRQASPTNADVATTLGRVLELRGNLEGAVALHNEALIFNPRSENAYLNRGTAKRFAGDFEGALADYNEAISLKPGFSPAIANRGLTYLILGRLQDAWPSYRSRIRALNGAPDLSADKPWDGSPLDGKRVFVWLEYGLGDEILFASLLPELLEKVSHCTVACSPRLRSLFQRSFPRARIVAMGETIEEDFDVRLPLTDVAQLLRPTLSSITPHNGYLTPDASVVEGLRARYMCEGNGRLIGLSWRSASGPAGRFKSIPLAEFADLLRLPGATFVSLQYGDCAEDIERLARETGCTIIHDPAVDTAGDLDRFAAQVAAMDLVISVSNTTVHVAGAMGRPVFALVPTGPGAHWYWFHGRTDTPWYPSVRLFRQEQRMDWQKPLASIKSEFASWLER